MALIGDVIISARELIPDMPQVLPPPIGAPTASVVAAAGSTLGVGAYYLVVTYRTPWGGETLPSAEAGPFTVGANQGIQITAPPIPFPTGSGVIRAYLTLAGGAAGTEQQFIESSTVPFTIATPPPSSGMPPSRNDAFLPDTNGKFLSAATLYRWLNQALGRLARKAGGVQDYTAVGSVQGQPLYTITGEWSKVTNAWYDGFPLSLAGQGSYFRRNVIQSSVLASCAIAIRTNQIVIELFYQPARTAGSTTLAVAMTATDTSATLNAPTGFQSFGPPMFALIGTEIVAFQSIGTTAMAGILRGVGGTAPAAWPIGTAVKELNVPLLGKRLTMPQYMPGNAGNLLPVPIGWDLVLTDFLVSRSREAEQDGAASDRLLKRLDDAAMDYLRANRQIAGPVQVGSASSVDTVPGFGTTMGGVVLP